MGSLINLAILVAVTTCILVCSSAIVCESHLRFVAHSSSQDESGSGSFADEICSTWALWTNRFLDLFLQDDYGEIGKTREGLFVLCVAFPFFLASTTVYILSLLQKKNKNKRDNEKRGPSSSSTNQIKHEGSRLALGDPHIQWWSFLALFLPTALICVDVLWNVPARFKGMSILMRSAILLANPFGVSACLSLSFFLVPVARGSYTIEWETDSNGFGWSWSPMHALVFHRMAGWSGAIFTGLHAVSFCYLYIVEGMDGKTHQSPLKVLWSALVPGKECWPSWLPWSPSHSNDSFVECYHRHKLSQDSSNITMEECLEAGHNIEENMGQCYGHWRNFMGTISALAFLVLCLTSFSYIRRHYYSIFYKTHIVAGSMMLIFAILHFQTILMYLFPSMVYYLATTIPTLIQQYRSYKNDGVRIKSIKSVEDSGGCVEVTMPMSSLQHQSFPEDAGNTDDTINFSSLSTPVYARVCVPSISVIWHPFSVMIKPKNTKDEKCTSTYTTSTSSNTRDSLVQDEEETLNSDPLLTSCNPEERDHHSEHVTRDDYEVVICFRSVGPFTKAWANSLLSTMASDSVESEDSGIYPFKTLLLDGFYPGAFPIPKIMQRHDAIFLMAGGVGIVPFVSVLQAWYHSRKQEYKQQRQQLQEDLEEGGHDQTIPPHVYRLPRKIVLYWSCREPGLVNHFLDHHLDFLLNADDDDSNYDPECSNLPSIELFCHLTRGRSASPSTLPPNEQSSLRQPLLPEQSSLQNALLSNSSSDRNREDEEEGTVPSVPGTSYSLSQKSSTSSFSSNSEVTSHYQQDSSTTDSPPSGGPIQVTRFDWMSFIVFAMILWFSFLIQVWQYSRRILTEAKSVSVRFNSIYLTLGWALLVTLSGECFRAWYFEKHALQPRTNEGNHLDSRIECRQGQREERISGLSSNEYSNSLFSRQARDALSPDSIASATTNSSSDDHSRLMAPSFVHRSALIGVVSVNIVSGRPDFQDIVDPIGGFDCPAVLLCGPEKLRENVKRTVQSDSKCAKKCSIYEEVSEM
jgi:hypothetical protein